MVIAMEFCSHNFVPRFCHFVPDFPDFVPSFVPSFPDLVLDFVPDFVPDFVLDFVLDFVPNLVRRKNATPKGSQPQKKHTKNDALEGR